MKKDVQLSETGKKLNPSVILLAVTGLVFVIYLIAGLNPLLTKAKTNVKDKKEAEQSIITLDEAMKKDLDQSIADLEAEMKALTRGEFIDESLVYDDIGEAAAQSGVTITNVSFSNASTSGKFKVHPIAVSASGASEALLQFIRYFETTQIGSYAVSNVSLNTNSLNMTLTLYTPG